MWWLARDQREADRLRRLLLYPAVFIFIAAFEGRIVFRSFASYIKLPAPWNYILVSFALYCLAGLVAAHFEGLMTKQTSTNISGAALVFAAGAGAIVAGFPAYVIPAPIACAVGLGLFYESGKITAAYRAVLKSTQILRPLSGLFRDYLIFATGAVISAGYFVMTNFVFLNVELGGLPLT